MTINKVNIELVKSNPNNPRVIKDDKYKKLKKSIRDFPEMLEIRPIVVDENMVVLGGNMRLKACTEVGLKEIPIIKVSELTEEQKKEFILKDNQSFGDWDTKLLSSKCEVVDGKLITESTACEYCKSKKSTFKAVVEKQQLTGPAMVPNQDILRVDENGEYYNCWFSEETIAKASSLYLKNSNHTSANFDHTNQFTDKVYIIESWIVTDPEIDKSKALGFNETKGTWMVTYQVDDKELWDEIKQSDFTGFSIEGLFDSFNRIEDEIIKIHIPYVEEKPKRKKK